MATYLYNLEEDQEGLSSEEVAAIGAYLLSLHKPLLEPVRGRHNNFNLNEHSQKEEA